jgi:hypothetical protein
MINTAAVLILLAAGAYVPATSPEPAEPRVLEIRSYNLKPGARAIFHRIVVEEAAPMLDRWNVDLVAYGPSAHDEDSYFVMRAYRSLEDRKSSHDAFYGSSEWIEGPRDRILALIETFTTVVVTLPSAAIDELRRTAAH